MKRKKGYSMMLTITRLFTLAALVVFAPAVWPSVAWLPMHGRSGNTIFITGIMLLLCAGVNCVVRKRFFTQAG